MHSVAAVRFFVFLFGILGVLFLIIATPTHYWYHAEVGVGGSANATKETFGGIFENCYQSGNSYTCESQPGDGYLKTTKAFLILGVIGYAVVIIYSLLYGFNRGICYDALGCLFLFTGFFVMIAMSVYTDQHHITDSKSMRYGWSFSLGWTSFVMAILAGILSFFGKVEYQQM